VVGDERYGSVRAVKYLMEHHGFHRLALHAFALSFKPPGSKSVKTIETKDIPASMRALFEGDKSAPS
jgi:23S rRNA-/tRNA-specific pseudouridylate synthase